MQIKSYKMICYQVIIKQLYSCVKLLHKPQVLHFCHATI